MSFMLGQISKCRIYMYYVIRAYHDYTTLELLASTALLQVNSALQILQGALQFFKSALQN